MILGLFGHPQPAGAQGTAQVDFNNILRATVFVTSVFDVPGGRAASCIGSGTLISPDGLILTNAHNVVNSELCRVDEIAVSLTIRLNEPPVPTYYADLVDYNLGLDLAVLRIRRQLDGRLIEPGSLNLPFVELGDSDQMSLDDTVVVFGYPGLGNEAVTFSRGTILGFTAEARGGERAWLKTSATILGTMSGGGAFDAEGRLIGIPTTSPAGGADAALDCRQVQDTNGDGQVDNRDSCVPVGGFINALRPSSLARGLVRAAQLGIRLGGHAFSEQYKAVRVSGEPRFGEIVFSPGVNEAGLPTTVVGQVPAGTNSLYLFFSYENMRPGMVYELRTTRNGIPSPVFSQSPALWSGGMRGLWYIGSAGQPWPNGVYEFTLFINGIPQTSAQITIGGAPQPTPAFSDVVFGLLDLQGNVIGSGYVLPAGNVASARFIFREMEIGMPWRQVWFYEGVEFLNVADTWNKGPSGSETISIREPNGLRPGRYRVELYIGDSLSAMSDFTIAGAQEAAFARIFDNLVVSDDIQNGEPAGAVSESFPNTVPGLYAFVNWTALGPGTPWSYRWLVDGEPLFEVSESWVGPETGSNFWLYLDSNHQLPDGSYTIELRLSDVLFVSKTVAVGRGQLPVLAGSEATGVRMQGQVVDAETGKGIPGVLFIVLKAEFSVGDFLWDESQVLDSSLTDSTGRFEIQRLLPYGEFYSVVVTADGYLPVNADGILLEPDLLDEPGQVDLLLELNRDYGT